MYCTRYHQLWQLASRYKWQLASRYNLAGCQTVWSRRSLYQHVDFTEHVYTGDDLKYGHRTPLPKSLLLLYRTLSQDLVIESRYRTLSQNLVIGPRYRTSLQDLICCIGSRLSNCGLNCGFRMWLMDCQNLGDRSIGLFYSVVPICLYLRRELPHFTSGSYMGNGVVLWYRILTVCSLYNVLLWCEL